MNDSPAMPRYQLGKELAALRNSAGMDLQDAADVLACSPSKIRRIEAGQVGLRRGDLMLLVESYGVADVDARAVLTELQEQGNQRGWWSKLGLPESLTRLLGFEAGASSIRIYEQALIPALLQTEAYASAVIRGLSSPIGGDELRKQVQLRLERQDRTLRSQRPPQLWVILDESVIRRTVGSSQIMREQLEYLLAGPYPYTLQVVPHRAGAHAGMEGAFWIFDFPAHTRTSTVSIETPGGILYQHELEDVERATIHYDQLRATALGESDSRQLITDAIREG